MNLDELKIWFVEYRKNKDLIFRKINNIDISDNVIITMKDGSIETGNSFFSIEDGIKFLKGFGRDDIVSIVLFNTSKNVSDLIKDWDKFVKYTKLTIYFVNMNSLKDKKWIIKPYVHDRITEKSALKLGIKSLASNVDYC